MMCVVNDSQWKKKAYNTKEIHLLGKALSRKVDMLLTPLIMEFHSCLSTQISSEKHFQKASPWFSKSEIDMDLPKKYKE